MPLSKLLFSFDGKITRGPFWLGVTILVVFGAFAIWLANALGDGYQPSPVVGIPAWLLGAWMFAAVGVKRCRDRDRPAWFMLFTLVPLLGLAWFIIDLGLLPSVSDQERTANRLPPQPRVVPTGKVDTVHAGSLAEYEVAKDYYRRSGYRTITEEQARTVFHGSKPVISERYAGPLGAGAAQIPIFGILVLLVASVVQRFRTHTVEVRLNQG